MINLKNLRYFSTSLSPVHTPFCIIGGGTAGINVAAQLARQKGILRHFIRVFEPNRHHYYQPGFTLLGAGLKQSSELVRYTIDLLKKGINLTAHGVSKIDPEKQLIYTEDGKVYSYDQLIVAAGIVSDYSKVKGLLEAIEDKMSPVGSIYHYAGAQKWSRLRESYNGGKVVFTDAPAPVKCPAAPQKIIHLSIETWKNKGISYTAQFHLNTDKCYGVEYYEPTLREHLVNKNVAINHFSKLIEVKGKEKIAVFQHNQTGSKTEVSFDYLHTLAPFKAPDFIKDSGLGDSAGLLNVDKETLQHVKYKNIWGVGDNNNSPNAKTAAAIYSQTPVVLKNIMDTWKTTNSPAAKYDGYAACPVLVGEKKVILAEFKYGGVLNHSFFDNQKQARGFFYFLKVHFFPYAYFAFAPRGVWYGKHGFWNSINQFVTEQLKLNESNSKQIQIINIFCLG